VAYRAVGRLVAAGVVLSTIGCGRRVSGGVSDGVDAAEGTIVRAFSLLTTMMSVIANPQRWLIMKTLARPEGVSGYAYDYVVLIQ
jgi:hypothetical protein